MKTLVAYPPLKGKGSPMLTQNRQFQWYHEPSYIYPIIPASLATVLKHEGHESYFFDAIQKRIDTEAFWAYLAREKFDIIFMESKTPVIRQHWQMINRIKEKHPDCMTVLMGDHVTGKPKESMDNCAVDFVNTGGDYDFLGRNLVSNLNQPERLEAGIYYRLGGDCLSNGEFQLNHDLDSLPFIDRQLTAADHYGEKWKKRLPFYYTMAARDCWWAKCTFCAWTSLFPRVRTRSVTNVLDEIEMLVKDHGVREIFDDSGTFPTAGWFNQFCEGMIRRGLNKKILFSCNMRVDQLTPERMKLAKAANFRKMKVGLESANQETLDHVVKGITVDQIIHGCRNAARAGIDIHLTVMIGYPWENRIQAEKTLALARQLMEEGSAEMLQSTVVVPYPGTPLFKEAAKNDHLRVAPDDYEKFDMSQSVLKTGDMSSAEVMKLCEGVYKSFLTPRYILRRLLKIRSLSDAAYIMKGARAVVGHLKDFGKKRRNASV